MVHGDVALALGTPVGLSDNPHKAVAELHRIVKQGGFVFCDMANQYRSALDLAKENKWAAAAADIFHRFAETPEMISISTRLLIAGRKI
ncbi:MAG: hypothetical protein PF482_18480 [Desulfobacteraceae bacterium]|jgi:ubiquinone/menaquinone biosynthesis C-methylase UbiE|nr:hypothetical protein [Desulfobacteraceae bacterium]